MKKSVRINLLVITIVVTLFVFAGLWYLRPGVSDDLLRQARIRQSLPLMEIAEPLRKPKAEDLIDTTNLVKELKRDLEPSIKAALKAELLADPAFVRTEVERVDTKALQADLQPAIRSALLADKAFVSEVSRQIDTTAIGQQVQAAVQRALLADTAFVGAVSKKIDTVALRNEIQPAIRRSVTADLSSDASFIRAIASQVDLSSVTRANEAAINALKAELTAQIANVSRSTVVTTAALDTVDIDRMVGQAVDAQIPAIVEATVARIEANRDAYIQVMRQALGDVVTEDELVDLYRSYRSAVVQDLVPEILADMERALKAESAVATPLVSEPPAVQPSKVVPVVAAEAATPAPPTVTAAQVQQVPQPPTVAPAVSAPQVVPQAPVVEKMVTKSVEEAEYEAERQRLRTEAINKVLKTIGE